MSSSQCRRWLPRRVGAHALSCSVCKFSFLLCYPQLCDWRGTHEQQGNNYSRFISNLCLCFSTWQYLFFSFLFSLCLMLCTNIPKQILNWNKMWGSKNVFCTDLTRATEIGPDILEIIMRRISITSQDIETTITAWSAPSNVLWLWLSHWEARTSCWRSFVEENSEYIFLYLVRWFI